MSPTSVRSTSSALDAKAAQGKTTPRLFSRPLVTGKAGPCGCGCALSPETSYGFDVADFARDVLGHPLDPWQRWLMIHAGELLPDRRPRFRRVVVLVSRQAGKTRCLVVLSLYWIFVERQRLVLGTSTTVSYAKEPWQAAVNMAQANDLLAAEIPARGGIRQTNGEQELTTIDGCRYKIAASNAQGGRGLSIDRLILDELREHHDYGAYNASVYAMNARPAAQVFALSNAGDDRSVVLNDLREEALGEDGDPRLGLFEWSAPDGADPEDVEALLQANPSLGLGRLTLEDLLGQARAAVRRGGELLAGFRTESMCQRVKNLDPAIDAAAWAEAADPRPLPERGRVMCLDVSPDQQHVTLCGAAQDGDKVRVELVQVWEGKFATRDALRALPGILTKAKHKPKFVWFPGGPAASLAAALADRSKAGRHAWPPPGVVAEEIRGELTAACMGLAEQVVAGGIAHPADPLLDQQVGAAERLKRGDAWVFSRKGAAGYVDMVYAAAGCVHGARTLPTGLGALRIVTAEEV